MEHLTFWILVIGGYLYYRASKHARHKRRVQEATDRLRALREQADLEVRTARERYQNALSTLDDDPSNLDSRKEALAAGRAFSETARVLSGGHGRALFDEVELQNDMAIRIGVAAATAGTPTRREKANPKCTNCGARSNAGAVTCSYCEMALRRG